MHTHSISSRLSPVKTEVGGELIQWSQCSINDTWANFTNVTQLGTIDICCKRGLRIAQDLGGMMKPRREDLLSTCTCDVAWCSRFHENRDPAASYSLATRRKCSRDSRIDCSWVLEFGWHYGLRGNRQGTCVVCCTSLVPIPLSCFSTRCWMLWALPCQHLSRKNPELPNTQIIIFFYHGTVSNKYNCSKVYQHLF